MDSLDSSTRHELSKAGYVFPKNTTVSHIVKTLIKDSAKIKNNSEDLNQLCRRNNDLSLTAMLYKSYLDEKEAELKSLKQRFDLERSNFQQQIKYLEDEILPKAIELPKSNILRLLGVSNSNERDPLNLIRYADKKLHELEATNRTLTEQLDKNVQNSSVLVNKVRLRDAEIQRLTQLVNTGSCNVEADSEQNRILREENVRLQNEIKLLSTRTSNDDYKSQLIKTLDERRDLAKRLDHCTSKLTSLQGVVQKYEYELKMARLERDQAVSAVKTANTVVVADEQPSSRTKLHDENGNVPAFDKQFPPTQNEDSVTRSKLDEKLTLYERKISRLLKDLATLREAITKKDTEIYQLRGEIGSVASTQQENSRLTDEVNSLKRNATKFQSEIQELRGRIQDYALSAARVVDSVPRTMTSTRTGTSDIINSASSSRESDSESDLRVDQHNDRQPNMNVSKRMESKATVDQKLSEKVTLLQCEVRRLQAQAALELETRLRTELKLRELEQNPPKKFKGHLRIDGGVLQTEFELSPDPRPLPDPNDS